jgi:divalent metal cation (Fe/Co/Zn/Cd) transporter
MIPLQPQLSRPAAGSTAPAVPGTPEWFRLARLARLLSWLTLGWLGIEAGVAIAAAVIAGSVALLGFGLDSGIEALASIIVIWRFTGVRLASATSERRAQQLVAVSFFVLAPYIAVEAFRALVAGDRPETSIIGLVLTAGTAIFEPALGMVKRRIGARLGSSATAGEGTQNLLCAYLAMAVFAGLAANTLWGAWRLDSVVALGIAGWAIVEGRRAWAGKSCGCGCQPGAHHCSAPIQSQILPTADPGQDSPRRPEDSGHEPSDP